MCAFCSVVLCLRFFRIALLSERRILHHRIEGITAGYRLYESDLSLDGVSGAVRLRDGGSM